MNKSKSNSITIILVIALTIGVFILGSVIGYMTKPNTAPVTQIVVTQVNVTQIAHSKPTYTPYPTYTSFPVTEPQIIIQTVEVLITQEIPPTPEPPPTTAAEALTAEKQPGIYLVNIDIEPGLWRNNGNDDGCYWSLTDRTGDIIENFLGQTGGTMYIPDSAFQAELQEECGTWTYLGPP